MYKKIIAIIALLALALPCAHAYEMPYYIEVDCVNNIVTVFSAADDTVVRQMICSCGVLTWPSPHGTYYMPKQHKSGERTEWYKFEDGYGKYGSRISGNFLFHSYLFDTTDDSTVRMETYAALGTNASHGCVRLRIDDAKWIAENCFAGTRVKLYDGKLTKHYLKQKLYLKTFTIDDGMSYNEFMSIATGEGELGFGSEGEEVTALQERLAALGLYSGAVDGVYGGEMTACVKAIQTSAELPVTGIADARFIEYISSESAPISLAATLSTGASGQNVKILQMLLALLGLYEGEITGEYDAATYEAVRAYQRGAGAGETGTATGDLQAAMVKDIAALTDMYGYGGYAVVWDEQTAQTGTVNTAGRLNVRAEASMDSELLGKLEPGQTVVIESQSDGWYRISLNGRQGYVMCAYLDMSAQTVKTARYVAADAEHLGLTCDMPEKMTVIGTSAVTYGTVNTSERLKIREAPNYECEVLFLLQPGAEVEILSSENGWVNIAYGGRTGYTRAELFDTRSVGILTNISATFGGDAGAFNAGALLPDPLSASYALVTSSAGAQLRAEALESAAALAQIAPGARAEVLMVKGEWTQVIYAGSIGYISSSEVLVGTAEELNEYSEINQ